MYTLSVPARMHRSREEFDEFVGELRRAGAGRVFLVICRSISSDETKKEALELLSKQIPELKKLGFEVGVWTTGFGHGSESSLHPEYQRIVPSTGHISTDSICPLEQDYTEEFARWIAMIASASPDLIMIDDDLRLGFRAGSVGCFCPLHLQRVSALLGETVDRETLLEKGLTGKANRYRDAWMKVNHDSLICFAKRMREAVDGVNPSIRLGHCAVLDTWDMDGVDSIELAKTFAGNTKPFLRLIGAPYWAALRNFKCNIANVIELERMQAAWCKDEDIEIFAEGDVFPRPRHMVAASYLEAMDTALRADGSLDGILKYMVDYTQKPRYEHGYVDLHVRHKNLYQQIESLFADKKPCGIRVYDCMHRLKDAELPSKYKDSYIGDDFVPASARLLCDNGIAMQYTQDDATVVFGENARHIPTDLLQYGGVLDAPAAKLLTERGYDVGFESIAGEIPVSSVYFPEYSEDIPFRSGMFGNDGSGFPVLKMKEGAEPFCEYRGPNASTYAYKYENKKGERFLIYPFEAKRVRDTSMLFRNYYTQKQLARELQWVRRAPLDAMIYGSPDVYLQTKRDEKSLAVGIWNLFEDSILSPVVHLGEKWTAAEFINCTGCLTDDSVRLDRLPAFGMAFILLKK